MASIDPHSSGARDPVDVLAEEFIARRGRGERPALGEYTSRFPELADEIRRVFPAALAMGRPETPARQPASITVDPSAASESATAGSPGRLGDFRILRELGRGGMGVVYEAVQESLGRHVALKILSMSGRLGPMQIERFQLEARSAARLHHVNIVPVFGVGVEQGVHYYAMQFIRGHGLDAILDEVRRLRGPSGRVEVPSPVDCTATAAPPAADGSTTLARSASTGELEELAPTPMAPAPVASDRSTTEAGSTSEPGAGPVGSSTSADPTGPARVTPASSESKARSLAADGHYARSVARIVLEVAEALAYAHQQGVLHRDIKPSNLLLDDSGRVWVTDFGLAKLEGSDGPTRTGDVVGTLRYMAPERFDGWSDRRSDVYSLGATLYEALTLRPLYAGTTYVELIEKIRSVAPEPPRKLDPAIPRDLETIVLKSLAKEPGDRYPSAEAVGEDLRRFLEDRPLLARPTTTSEQVWRWCRRNRRLAAASIAAAVATVSLAVGATAAAWTFRNQRDQNDRLLLQSRRSEAETRAVLGFFRSRVLAAARPKDEEGGLGREATIRAALDAAAPAIAATFAGQPAAEASIRQTLGQTYIYLGEYAPAIRETERARALRLQLFGPDHPDTLESAQALGSAYAHAGRLDDALRLDDETARRRMAMMGADHPDTLSAMSQLATIYHHLGRLDEALRLHDQTLRRRRSTLGSDHPDTMASLANMANALMSAGRLVDAIRLYEEDLDRTKALCGPDHPSTLISMGNLANAYREAGRLDDALPLMEQALRHQQDTIGPLHPHTLFARSNLALAYQTAGRYPEAVKFNEVTLEQRTAGLGRDHPDTLTSINNLAFAYWYIGRADRAVALHQEALDRRRARFGPDHFDSLDSMNNLALATRDAGRVDEALRLLDETVKRRRATLGPDHSRTLVSMYYLAETYSRTGRVADALPLYEETLKRQRATLGDEHPNTLVTMDGLARAYLIGQPVLAEPVARRSLEIRERKGPDNWRTFDATSLLGGSLMGQEKYADAEPFLVRGYEGMKARESGMPAPNRRLLAEGGQRVVRLYEEWGKPVEAERWRKKLAEAASGGKSTDR